MSQQPKYRFYGTLLDAYEGYINSQRVWSEYWGFSEDPKYTESEFEEMQRQSLLNRINRAPIPWEETEAMDKGSVFNEIVDCIIEKRKSDKMEIASNKEALTISATYNNRTFVFPTPLCVDVANDIAGAVLQQFVSAPLETKYGTVELYGYADAITAFQITDIKTTSKYSAPKYLHNWQHLVYPYCLQHSGTDISEFNYLIIQMGKGTEIKSAQVFAEFYTYVAERDEPRLREHVEGLIEFVEAHRDIITDTKIFNQN
jgi:hypothetical protein